MHTLRVSEIHIYRNIRCYLLLECHIGCIDARVRVVTTEHSHAGEQRELSGWRRRTNWSKPRPDRRRRAKQSDVVRAYKVSSLLSAVGRKRTDLAQHILARVVDSPARAQNRLPSLGDIPGHPDPRLEFLFLIVKSSVRRESRIVKERSVCCLARIDDR